MSYKFGLTAAMLVSSALVSTAAISDDGYVITEKDKQFSPRELTIPAGQKVKITIKNMDAVPAEWESNDFEREKVVSANSEINVFIGPLDAGKYTYFDDFHHESTGTIIAK